MERNLNADGREQLALALILLKDFKAPYGDVMVFKMVYDLAQHLGVANEFDTLLSKIPPMKIEPR
jgi:hypothetical protein